jgi:hypothetical protein
MTKRIIAVTAALSAAVALGAAMMETVQIESASVALRAKSGRAQPLVAELSKGQTAEVLERSGKWLKLKAGEHVGWAHEADLKPRNKAFSGTAVVVRDLTAGGVEEGAAGKGVGEGASVYAKSQGMNPAPLDGLVARRKQIVDSGEWVRFAEEGKVGVR